MQLRMLKIYAFPLIIMVAQVIKSIHDADSCVNLLFLQLVRRPCPNFMETVQRDITQSMRGILVDWLVEVSIISLPDIIISGITHAFVKHTSVGVFYEAIDDDFCLTLK